MTETGKKYCVIIGAYMVIKAIINGIMGFSIGNIITLLISVVLAVLIIAGVPYCNYVTAVYLAVVSVMHLIPNITGHQWFYLAEGILDLIAAAILFVNKDVRAV